MGSYERQISYYKEKIEKREGWILAGIYADEGISGTKKQKRDGFLKLIQDCNEGKIDLILTQKVSNVSKKMYEITFCARVLATQTPPIGIYFISEDIYTLASYYKEDLRDESFLPYPDRETLPDDETRAVALIAERSRGND